MKPRRVAILVAILLVPVLLFAGYVWLTLHWSYSDGERSGILQKFSRKGWVFKTYEGELAMTTVPGVAPVIWNFSVRDPAVANRIFDGHVSGRRVVLHYTEHRGVPTTWFAETSYFVDDFRFQDDGVTIKD